MSGALLAIQTNTFRRLLGGHEHEYVFLDGEIESSCVIGLEENTTGPYYRWSIGATCQEIKNIHDYVESVIEEEGPFDGVLGFSQGSSIAASLMLQHEINHPKDPPPFNFAILFSCFMVVSLDINYAKLEYRFAYEKYSDVVLKVLKDMDLSKVADEKDDAEFLKEEEFLKAEKAAAEKNERGERPEKEKRRKEVKVATNRVELLRPSRRAALVAEIFDVIASSARVGAAYHSDVLGLLPKDLSGGLEIMPRIYHPLLMSEKIKIPTVHITGRNDPFFKQTNLAKSLFDKDTTRSIEHSGAHDVPRIDAEIKSAVAAAQWAIQRSQMAAPRGWKATLKSLRK